MPFDLLTPIRTRSRTSKVVVVCGEFVAVAAIGAFAILGLVYAPDKGTYISLLRDLTATVAIIVGGLWTYSTFIQRREQETALAIDLDYITEDYGASRHLTLIDIGLKNQGKVRLDASKKPYEHTDEGAQQKYEYGCSLKIREVPNIQGEVVHLDWFHDLPSPGWGKVTELNALSGYVKRVGGAWGRAAKIQTDFWMEPGESYSLAVPVFLRAGNYFALVTFLGGTYEEYWQRMFLLRVPKRAAGFDVYGD